MSSGLLGRFTRSLQPPPLSLDYEGTEYRWGNLVFRPAEFYAEGLALGIVGFILAIYFIGKKLNQDRAGVVWKTFDAKFSNQFKAMSPLPSQPRTSNSPSTWLHYLTGRRSLISLHVIINLVPRYNIVQLVQDFVWSIIDPTVTFEDQVEFDFTLGVGDNGKTDEGPGVWAVVAKSGVLPKVRKERWDATFTKTVENSALPLSHILLTESADSTDYILNAPNIGLLEALNHEITGPLLKSLIITDQPATRPAQGPLPDKQKARTLTITLSLPSNSSMEAILPWAQVGLNLCDYLSKTSPKPETTRKLRKIRQEVAEELTKAWAEELKEEEGDPEEEKRVAKRKEEAKRRAALSDAERRKLEEKEKKKRDRKAQIKAAKGGR